nr:putative homoserine kinase type II [uncultured bacterium]
MNEHWRVESEAGVFALRRYNARRSSAAIEAEHELLLHGQRKGWPVAVPVVRDDDGSTLVSDGRTYALFPFLAGRPPPYGNARWLRIKGRLLARLHRDLEDAPLGSQRDGFGRAWELDLFVQAAGHESFNRLLAAFGREYPELARGVRAERYRNLRELAKLGYGELRVQPVHCDFHHDNVLVSRGEVTGLLDFDSARLDARVADLACSISLDGLEPPDHDAINPGSLAAFVGGYAEALPLSAEDERLVVPLIRAQFLLLVTIRLMQRAEDRAADRPVASIERSVHGRFPALAARTPDLEAAVMTGRRG